MKLKELLEKIDVRIVVRITLYSKKSEMCKEFISRASDFLEDKIWLDKEVVKIFNEPLDDYTCRINVVLHE